MKISRQKAIELKSQYAVDRSTMTLAEIVFVQGQLIENLQTRLKWLEQSVAALSSRHTIFTNVGGVQ